MTKIDIVSFKNKVLRLYKTNNMDGLEAERDKLYQIATVTRDTEWLKSFNYVTDIIDLLKKRRERR